MAKQTKLILGGLFFALMFFYHGVNFYFQFVEVGSYTGWRGYSNDGRHFYTTTPDPNGPTSQAQKGDELIAINGTHPADDWSLVEFADRAPAGTLFSMTFQRNGQAYTILNRTIPYPPDKNPYQNYERLIYGLIWLLFLVTGAALIFLKAELRQAWLLALMLGTFTGIMTDTYPYSALSQTVVWIVALAKIAAFWFFPFFALFYLNFPERSKLLLKWPHLESSIYVIYYLLLLPFILGSRLPANLRSSYYKLPLMNLYATLDRKFGFSNWVVAFFLIIGLFFIGYNYWQTDLTARRRIRVAVLGSTPGYLGLLLLVFSNFPIFNIIPGWKTLIAWIPIGLYLALPLIPLSFAYAIIKHQVIPISLIIRRGMRYVLVSRGSYLLEIGVFFVIITTFLTFFFRWLFSRFEPSSMESVGIIVGTISATVGIIFWNLTRYFHTKFLAPVIDRKFFRQSYDSQQIISELVESLRTTTEQEQLLAKIATKIRSALQTESVAILLRGSASEDYVSVYYCEYNPVDGGNIHCENNFRLPIRSNIVSRLHNSREPVNIDEVSLPDDEIALLRQIKSELLLPLSSQTELLGIVSLGARLGDLPFSTEDKELLMSVAGPGTFALENALLLERMIEEARRREEIETENEARAKELEEARQIQLSMLPRSVPQNPNYDIAAYMKTATEVGGDYYDFHVNAEGVLTVMVGDATGHGLKAGTIVTATKSLFNNLAGMDDIPEIFRQSSNALKMMNLRSLYMAMTMAKLDGYKLTVSLAGMPAVLIYRAATNTVEEIALRGMPLGSIKNYVYKQQTTTLEIGDIIVLLSDGFPERFNPASEILGFEKAGEILANSGSLSAQQLINKFIQIGDEWGDSRPQDDDVTFVVLKIIKPPASRN